MMLALLLSFAGAAAPNPRAAVRSDDPPVKIWLNHDTYRRGDKARVNVRLSDDGYVVVLRADTDGRVRVLFPLDPSDDAFVRGGETIEVRGRGDREAFYVDDRDGSGVVLAARSVAPFKFDEFVRGDHWDYRVLTARDAGDDKEAALVDIVQRMAGDGHFDYDAVTYGVGSERAYYDSYYPSYSMVHFGYGWGSPYGYGYYSTCYDPFFYDPFLCYDPLFYAPYRYGFTYGFGFGYPYYFRPYGYGYTFYRQPRNLFINRLRTGVGVGMSFKDPAGTNRGVGGIGPRFRIPAGTMGTRVRSGVGVRERDARQSDAERRASFPVRDRSVRDRGDQPDRGVRDRGDRPGRPADRPAPAAREPSRQGDRRGADRPAPERPRDRSSWSAPRSSGGGGRGMSQPRGGERSAPANRGGGGGGGGGGRGNGGGGGGGGRRRP